MKVLVLPFVLCFMFVSSFAYDLIQDDEWVKNYFTELKKTYDKRVPPIGQNGPGSPVKVNISMWILDISEVHDSNMDYTAQFYFRQSWTDSRLRYTDKTDVLILRNANDIWTPDLFFTGSKEGRLEHIVHPNVLLKINPDGSILLSVRITMKISCGMDLRFFPHDTQHCDMRIESYAHTKKHIEPEWSDGKTSVGVSEHISLFNFDLTYFEVAELVETVSMGKYKVLNLELIFQRKFGFFAIKLYVPFIILVILSLSSLWIKAEERGLRLSLLAIILYFMINIALDVSDNIPDAPYTKGTDVWIGFCESFVFAIFLEFIAVALIASRHERQKSESKGEILLSMESESKEQSMKSDTLKSHLYKLVNMFDARNGGKGKRDKSAFRIDKICRIVFPLIFILFNVVYWSVYCCNSTE